MRNLTIVSILALSVVFGACGSKDGGDGGHGGDEAVGSWVLDKEALRAAIDRQPGQEQLKEESRKNVAAMEFTGEIRDDGTYSLVVRSPAGNMSSKGTWTRSGKVISFDATEENGVELKEPDTTTGTLDGDKIYLSEDDVPFEIVLKKK